MVLVYVCQFYAFLPTEPLRTPFSLDLPAVLILIIRQYGLGHDSDIILYLLLDPSYECIS
jgi:hypothetical protein